MMLKKKILAMALAGGLVLGGAASVDGASLMSMKDLSFTYHVVPVLKDKASATTCYGKGGNDVSKYQAYTSLKVTNTDGKEIYSKSITRTGWEAVSGEGPKGLCKLSFTGYKLQKADSVHKGKKDKSNSSWDETYTKGMCRK